MNRPDPQERWFEPEELREMARPTMDRATEAIDRGDVAAARELCDQMSQEWRFLHDIFSEMILGLVDFIQDRLGDDGVGRAWEHAMERGWKRDTTAIIAADRRKIVAGLAATWRAHSTSGRGPDAGAFTIDEDDEKFTFSLHPCGSGARLVRLGRYSGPDGYGVTEQAHDWSFGRSEMPLYCTHCSFMNESLPIKWYGAPLYPLDPPVDYQRDPCRWYWYKDPSNIPERFWRRYGAAKPEG